MLEQFQPFIDYKKLIEMQAKGCNYRLSKNDKIMKNNTSMNSTIKSKVRKIGKK